PYYTTPFPSPETDGTLFPRPFRSLLPQGAQGYNRGQGGGGSGRETDQPRRGAGSHPAGHRGDLSRRGALGEAEGEPPDGPPAPGEAGDRPHRQGSPPGPLDPRFETEALSRFGPPGRLDHRRLHRHRGRPHGPERGPASALPRRGAGERPGLHPAPVPDPRPGA